MADGPERLGGAVIPSGPYKGKTFHELFRDPTGEGLLYLGWVRDGGWAERAYPEVHEAAALYLAETPRPARLAHFRETRERATQPGPGQSPHESSCGAPGLAPDRVRVGGAWYLRETPERACAGEFVREIQAAANVLGSLPWRGRDRSGRDDEMSSDAYRKLQAAVDAVIRKSIEMAMAGAGAGPTEAVTEGKANDADGR